MRATCVDDLARGAGRPHQLQMREYVCGGADRCQRIAQLMCQCGEKLVFAAIRLTQVGFHALALGDIARHLGGADDMSGGVANRRDGQRDFDLAAIPSQARRIKCSMRCPARNRARISRSCS